MFDLLQVYVENDLLQTFVNVISFVVALDVITIVASLLFNSKGLVSNVYIDFDYSRNIFLFYKLYFPVYACAYSFSFQKYL